MSHSYTASPFCKPHWLQTPPLSDLCDVSQSSCCVPVSSRAWYQGNTKVAAAQRPKHRAHSREAALEGPHSKGQRPRDLLRGRCPGADAPGPTSPQPGSFSVPTTGGPVEGRQRVRKPVPYDEGPAPGIATQGKYRGECGCGECVRLPHVFSNR